MNVKKAKRNFRIILKRKPSKLIKYTAIGQKENTSLAVLIQAYLDCKAEKLHGRYLGDIFLFFCTAFTE